MHTRLTEQLHFSTMADNEVERVLKQHKIGLTVSEARKIEELLGRAPTLTEAIMWGIQGSEHSSYRSSRKYLSRFPTSGPTVMLGPSEDSGIVELVQDGTKRFGIVVSHESHNHPSQVVPYEGAATGVGGNIRDVACMGARVIGTLDPLRFGDIKKNQSKLIASGVTAGIAGYGNPVGVPNLGGDVYFDESFNDNCLVNVVCLGVLEEKEIIHSSAPENSVGYHIIIVGKPTDNSGMGGAAFASEELSEEDKDAKKSAVQEPNPFLKRHLLAATYELFKLLKEKNLIDRVGFKDMGAGGNMCATVELVGSRGLGAEIDLEKIPVAMKNLHPSVIACSETQERFAWIVPPEISEMVVSHYNDTWALPKIAKHARAAVVGTVTEGNYILKYKDTIVCDARAEDITQGLRYDRVVTTPKKIFREPNIPLPKDLSKILLQLLASENIASRINIYETYDKNVQGNTVLEPGVADAGVIAPLTDRDDASESAKLVGLAVSCDGNPRYGLIDPYLQGMNAVVESMRNVAAVGADPIALTDCLNYGNPEKPEQMWEFVQGVDGIADACNGIHIKGHLNAPTPIISGNVSLYNESKRGSIAASAIVACLGRISDYRKAVTMDLKKVGSTIYLLGRRRDELGGSEYYRLFNELGKNVPRPHLEEAESHIHFLPDIVAQDFVLSCHDISEGGLAVTLAEMAIRSHIIGASVGLELDISHVPEELRVDRLLFSETGGFVLEVAHDVTDDVEHLAAARGIELIKLGVTTAENTMRIQYKGDLVISTTLEDMTHIWTTALREKMN